MLRVTTTLVWTGLLFCAWCQVRATTGNTTTPKVAVSQLVVNPYCIRSVQDLVTAFRDRKIWHLNPNSSQEDSLFDFTINFALSYLSYAVYYHYPSAGKDNYNFGNGECCKLSSGTSSCHAFINHSKKVYQVLPGALVFLFGSPLYIILGPNVFDYTMSMAIKRFCWDIPPFCPEVSRDHRDKMLTDFTLVIPNLVRGASYLLDINRGYIEEFSAPRWNGQLTDTALQGMWPAIFLYVLSVVAPIVVLPLIIKAISKYEKKISSAMKRSNTVNIAIATVMFNSWIWALYLSGVHIAIIVMYEQHLTSDPSHLPEYVMPHTYYGLYSYIAMLVILLFEFPFLFYILIKSPLIYSNRPAGPLCITTWLLRALGWMGVVYFVQIVTTFSTFFTLFFFTAPLSAITSMSLFILLILSCGSTTGVAFSIMVQFFKAIVSGNKKRTALRSVWLLFYLAAIFVSSFMVGGILFTLLNDDDGPTFNPRVILSSILASALVGATLYTLKIIILKQFVVEAEKLDYMEEVTYTE